MCFWEGEYAFGSEGVDPVLAALGFPFWNETLSLDGIGDVVKKTLTLSRRWFGTFSWSGVVVDVSDRVRLP